VEGAAFRLPDVRDDTPGRPVYRSGTVTVTGKSMQNASRAGINDGGHSSFAGVADTVHRLEDAGMASERPREPPADGFRDIPPSAFTSVRAVARALRRR
jgi:hypothetical protein